MSTNDYKKLLSSNLTNYDYTKMFSDDPFDEYWKTPPKKYTAEQDTTTSTSTTTNSSVTTTDISNLYNGNWHRHHINAVWDDFRSASREFSKSEFLSSLSKGVSIVTIIEKTVDELTDNGVIDCIEFIEKIGLLSSDLFWTIAYKKPNTYIMYPEFHSVQESSDFIEYSNNKNYVQYTRQDVRNNIEFTRIINKLKLKGKL